MNILKARAKRRDNGEWVVGYPCDFKGRATIRLLLPPNPFYENLYVDPDTLGYATGKLDKHGREIYGGMKVKVPFFTSPFTVEWDNAKSSWYLKYHEDGYSMMLWEKRSETLEIIDEKDEAKP